MPGLTDIPGILVGHATDPEGLTGCTVILCEHGAVAGVDVRGGATGTEELYTLHPGHITPKIHAVVLAGGSAFGLEAASGVRRYLAQKGIGFPTPAAAVPIVVGAILYDLAIGKPDAWPDRNMGEAAARAATVDAPTDGAIGAGTGATVGKILGLKHAMKSGIGSASMSLGGALARVRVAALAAVNALGDVRDPQSGKIIAGARRSPDSMEFLDTERFLTKTERPAHSPWNTTLVVVATNARFTKVEAQRIARMAQLGVARTISPAHTIYDGDLVIALSTGEELADLTAVGSAAAHVTAEAIVRAVRHAPTMGGVPGLASLE